MANIERLTILADALENKTTPIKGFDMSSFVVGKGLFDDPKSIYRAIQGLEEDSSCFTAACLAGHTVTLFEPPYYGGNFVDIAQYILGLTRSEAERLFMPTPPSESTTTTINYWESLTRKQAITTLRHFIKTGEIDWEVRL